VTLVLVVAGIYGQTWRHGFVNLDDPQYVLENPHVSHGLSWDSVIWAFTHFHSANWDPLTWLSHMLDCQWFGATDASAGGHHLVSAGFHAATSVLLFLALLRMTGARRRSAITAAIFATHPLRVESVAWVAERKDVLSGFFFALTLLAYAHYTARPRAMTYLITLATAALGLLSKPMLVTLPLILLLLDFWPLKRSSPEWPWSRLLTEKLPFFVLAVATGTLTVMAQKSGGALMPFARIGALWRIVTASLAAMTYIWKLFWPGGLAVYYVHPAATGADPAPYVPAALADAAAVIFTTVLVVRMRMTRPYLLSGWLWYLIMLAPVSGLMQIGTHLWADRFAYLPLIGITIMVVWGVADLMAERRRARIIVSAATAAVLAAFTVAAYAQTRVWRNSGTLYEHATRVTKNNWLAENNLGAYLWFEKSDAAGGREHFERAIAIFPGYATAHRNLASILLEQGDVAGAREHFERALRLWPDDVGAIVGIATLRAREGRLDEARVMIERALRNDPDNAAGYAEMGFIDASSGRLGESRRDFETALRINPQSVLAEHGLARWLATAPDSAERDPRRALELARRAAVTTHYRRPDILATLAAAYAAGGDFRQAIAWQERALALVPEAQRPIYRQRLQLYQQGRTLISGPR
jgi:tetratricopeptide (TPR) repeat protein